MAWEKKANKLLMGKFVRAKAERMVLITFQGEPVEKEGKNFKQEIVDELQFPVKFYDERSVGEKYKEGEALRIVLEGKGEDKIMPVQGGPLLRCLMEEHNEESIMERTFVLSHTGQSRETVYKLREVRIPKGSQSRMIQEDTEEEDEPEPIPEKKAQDKAKEKKFSTPETVRRARKATITVPEDDPESIKPKFDANGRMLPEGQGDEAAKDKAKFMKEVEKKTKARKKKEVRQDPPDEPIEPDCPPEEEDFE